MLYGVGPSCFNRRLALQVVGLTEGSGLCVLQCCVYQGAEGCVEGSVSSGLCRWVLLCLPVCFLWGKARAVQQCGQKVTMEAVRGGGSPAKVAELRADL